MKKLVVVTGGTKGIGRAVVEKFAGHGFDVVVSARNAAELSVMQSEVERKFNVQVFVRSTDMAVKEAVTDFTHFIRQLNRPVDVLVNNTGYFVPGQISSEPDGTLEGMMNANLYSAYHMTRGLVDGMKAANRGHIFNMCSIASFTAYPNGGSYAISKFALLGFSKCLREELKSFQIRVTAVMPGATRTASWDGVDLPDERFMSAEDVADSIFNVYSLSPRTVVEEIVLRPQQGDI
ncbi:MAG: SDR family NAD(P)-dependent oxidoreductase [Cyclobacteriaceae bacterium]|nr:SDR family NAD(P)-dependent oxidoreductase [Cyclobacteriaceae bacterium]